MATGLYRAPRSPGRGDTIASLRRLKESNYHNPDTGTEVNEGEADEHLHHLENRHAERTSNSQIHKLMRQKTRSRGRPYMTGRVVFRRINGHIVPFKYHEEPSL